MCQTYCVRTWPKYTVERYPEKYIVKSMRIHTNTNTISVVMQILIPSRTSAATIFLILSSPYQIGNGKKTPSSYGVGGTQSKLGLPRENPSSITDFYHLQLPKIVSELFETYVIRSVVMWSTSTYPPFSTRSHPTTAVNPFLSHSSPSSFINFWARYVGKRRPTEHLLLLKIEKNDQKKFCCTRTNW